MRDVRRTSYIDVKGRKRELQIAERTIKWSPDQSSLGKRLSANYQFPKSVPKITAASDCSLSYTRDNRDGWLTSSHSEQENGTREGASIRACVSGAISCALYGTLYYYVHTRMRLTLFHPSSRVSGDEIQTRVVEREGL